MSDPLRAPVLDYATPQRRQFTLTLPKGLLEGIGCVTSAFVLARTIYGTLWSVGTYIREMGGSCGTVRMYAYLETDRLIIWLLVSCVGVAASWRLWPTRMISLITVGTAFGAWLLLHAALKNLWPFR